MIEFRRLTTEDEQAFMTYIQSWNKDEELVPSAVDYDRYDTFEALIDALAFRESGKDWVKNTTLFLFVDDSIVGAGNIRHTLDEALLARGGHIGYGTGPAHRGKGYATDILRRSLAFLRDIGVNRVLVTCDEDNLSSAQVIIKNGGVEDVSFTKENNEKVRRFWIDND